MSRLQVALQELLAARDYTHELLRDTKDEDWFRQPREGITHIAWQVGHLAFAEYSLALKRIRGVLSSDAELVSDKFLAHFGRGSSPTGDSTAYPSVEEIRATFDRVHREAVRTVEQLNEAQLDEGTQPAHARFNTKLGAILWCGQHEMLHAGQIGLLRRLIGYEPKW